MGAGVRRLRGPVHDRLLFGLGYVPATFLPATMFVAGVASAFIFAPTLGYAASMGDEARASTMALIQAAGCLGMLVGPPAAGIVVALTRSDADPAGGYRNAFLLAAAAIALWLALAIPWIARRARQELGALKPSEAEGSPRSTCG